MSKEKKPSAFMKPVKVSKALAKIVGEGPMPRTEVTKNVWAYIKKHNLQAKDNKRDIIPDEKLSEVVGKQRINMFAMTKKISEHLEDAEMAKSR